MHLAEVLEGGGHLRHHGPGIGGVHAADVAALERGLEALGQAVALQITHRHVHGFEAQLRDDLLRLGGDVGAAVVREDLQCAGAGHTLDTVEALLQGLDEHLVSRLARQPSGSPAPGAPRSRGPAVLHERRCGGLARVAFDLEAVRAPARNAVVYPYFSLGGRLDCRRLGAFGSSALPAISR